MPMQEQWYGCTHSELGARRRWVPSSTVRALYTQQWPGTHCREGLVGHRDNVNGCGKPAPGHSTRSELLYRLSHPSRLHAMSFPKRLHKNTSARVGWGKKNSKSQVIWRHSVHSAQFYTKSGSIKFRYLGYLPNVFLRNREYLVGLYSDSLYIEVNKTVNVNCHFNLRNR
jgi:hypothetical protein